VFLNNVLADASAGVVSDAFVGHVSGAWSGVSDASASFIVLGTLGL
jgi:hypothetical protein